MAGAGADYMYHPLDWSRYAPYFSRSEFLCKCGACGLADMDPTFMQRLYALRVAYDRPMRITSGFRCPQHNANVSTTGTRGPHTTGRAADIQATGPAAYDLLQLAFQHGFTGVGVKQNGSPLARFIHLDTLTGGGRPWLWTY